MSKRIIWLVSKNEIYNQSLTEYLVNHDCTVYLLNQTGFKEKIHNYVRLKHDKERNLTIILDIEFTISINVFTQLLNTTRSSSSFSYLKVLVLSNFFSWGGKFYSSPIENFDKEFHNRRCLSSAYEIYSLENYLITLKQKWNLNLQIVATGLFYGGKGYQLYNIFNNIWQYDSSVKTDSNDGSNKLVFHSKNKVPITNFKVFSKTILSLIATSEIIPKLNFLAVIDQLNVPLLEVLNTIDKKINSLPEFRLQAEPEDVFGLRLCENASLAVWLCDIPSNQIVTSDNENISLMNNSEVIWSEFLSYNCYNPISILMTGAPNLGKTEVSKLISERLKIQYIDLEAAVKFLLKLDISVLSVVQSDFITSLKKELTALVEAKANEGKKPVKGAPIVSTEEFIVDESILTSSFCQTHLPMEFSRKCIAVFTSLHSICQRRGYILDAWDSKTITDLESLRGALNIDNHDSITPSKMIEFLIELQCQTNSPMEKLMASLGPQASKNKESQAIIKSFESTLNNYNSNLVSLDDGTLNEEAVAGHLLVGHKGAKEIGIEINDKLSLIRLDAVNLTTELILETAINNIYRKRDNKIGWLPDNTVSSDYSQSIIKVVNNTSDTNEVVNNQEFQSDIAPIASEETLSEKLNKLDSSKIDLLASRAEKLQIFLSKTVLPEIAKGMIQIVREKPDDPIKYLAEELYQQSKNRNESATEIARTRFLNALQ